MKDNIAFDIFALLGCYAA